MYRIYKKSPTDKYFHCWPGQEYDTFDLADAKLMDKIKIYNKNGLRNHAFQIRNGSREIVREVEN